ncbi:TIGR04283 family arsenosugar biosynthesis glycosyltransferase [Neolewinella agarilytica]|uniref:Transferase 2, rSAM/selenodomain-associated n=1 Tax=Neolewinella agarilytica TaxID=478744 RepID=A0A1H9IPE4_9BACT|nr:TIGR04283 family arsenosugar biosynthesis glycosyltransferase [Neolewinella agarilytica]SEQ76483.1 transferase 2, rSAM/selenodomain-associated [Neolewinella agarilytica]
MNSGEYSSDNSAPWLSIIIPTLNEAEHLPALLDVLGSGISPTEIEIIISDGGSRDGTQEIVQSRHLQLIDSLPPRSRQLNEGAKFARGQYLWFLHADTLPPPDWQAHLQAAAQQHLPSCFSIVFAQQERSWWLRRYAAGSRFNLMAFRFGDQSLFVSASLFRTSGGYKEEMYLMEGHILARQLRKLAGGFYLLPANVTTSARRYFRYGVVYTQLVFVLIFCLYYLGASHSTLVKLYSRAFRSS